LALLAEVYLVFGSMDLLLRRINDEHSGTLLLQLPLIFYPPLVGLIVLVSILARRPGIMWASVLLLGLYLLAPGLAAAFFWPGQLLMLVAAGSLQASMLRTAKQTVPDKTRSKGDSAARNSA
jgi:hypothetical protein